MKEDFDMELTPLEKMMAAAKVQLILHRAIQEKKPECYHAICMWSADSCCKCKYDMDCYHKWLEHMSSKTK